MAVTWRYRRLGLRHLRTRPYTPRTNGNAERFTQSALREWAYAEVHPHSDVCRSKLQRWIHRYNWHRPTPPSALNLLSPDGP